MLSVDDHRAPDPSSSAYQNHHQQVSHEAPASVSVSANTVLLKPTDANLDDTNNPLPNFSIRDYVFGSRSADITCNWPFSCESLQLCLHYGVKNFLPPFQSLDLLRSNTSISRCAVENGLHNEETVIRFDVKSTDDRFVSATSSSIESQCHLEEDLACIKSKRSHPASSQPTVKKCKQLVMKLNSGIEPIEEVTPNNFMLSETMASKVCPVCKTFSSSSNTTLNAHIDQCLSEESSMKLTANSKIIVKHRIKPRKMRLMMDIYETAPQCTVEELDRRNGTSWAADSKFPDQKHEFQAEKKKDELHELTFIPEVADHEGAVYIDTDGTKIRILSMPKVSMLDDDQARKLQKGGKGSKFFTEKKKKKAYGLKNRRKVMKLSPDSKKSRALKPRHAASEEMSGQEENIAIEESCNNEDRGENLIKAQAHKKMDDLAVKRPPLACCKRNGLTKSFNGATTDLLVENDKSFSGCGSRTIPSSSKNLSTSCSSNKARTSSVCKEQPLKTKSLVKSSSKNRFPMLIKPNKGTLLNDSYEDPSISKKKSSKFSSLKKNLLSASCESNAVSMFNLKRKFSALKKSHVHSLSMENAVMEPSQDSSKQKSRIEEHIREKLSFEIGDVLEVKKKSVSNVNSPGGLEITLESSRNEVSYHPDHVGNDVQQSFMGLKNSLDNDIYVIGHNVEDCMADIVKQGNCFEEVDSIPIPGPPGSFLPPSPGGDMESEELQGNSSLTTMSRVQSTEDQHNHDTMNRDCISSSPISTISGPSFAKSGSRSGYTGVLVDAVDKISAQIASSVNTTDLRSVDPNFTETGSIPSGIQNDHPCCSRSAGTFSKNVALCNQESSVLREHALESNMRAGNTNFMSKFFPLINYPTLPPPESVKLPVFKDCKPAVRPSTPVLRLMGKNLTVVKTDDDVSSLHHFQPPPCSTHQQHHSIQNNHYAFFDGYPPYYSIISNHNQNGSVLQHFNLRPNSRSLADLRHIHESGLVATADYHRLDHTKKGQDHINVDNAPTKATKEMTSIDDLSENEADEDSYVGGDSLSPVFCNSKFQSSSHLREAVNDGTPGKWGCTKTGSSSIYYPRSFS